MATHVSGALLVGALIGGCAGPIPGLWPPADQDSPHTIIVSIDTWHAMIAFPRTSAESKVLSPESPPTPSDT
ncbi:MAG: hypothetical protein ACREI3_11770, partial [Nitrospirales bacterium]